MNAKERKIIEQAVEIIKTALEGSDTLGEESSFEIRPEGITVVDGEGGIHVDNGSLDKALEILDA